MDVEKSREFSGRKFTEEEIKLIKATISAYPKLPQKELASTVCELLGWVQANGNPKTIQCLKFLRKLDEEGEVDLPPIKRPKTTGKQRSAEVVKKEFIMMQEKMYTCDAIRLEVIRPGEGLQYWRKYMNTYHSLGDPHVFGSQIRYMIKTEDGHDVGCMLFSAASWALAPRDEWIGWRLPDREARLQLVVNNSRFLIFPWVQVKNLASRALSIAARRIQDDWIRDYCYAPVLMETFVDISLYKGTCYKAANWIYLGETQGRGRNDRHTQRALTRKAIYVYPLQRDFRDILIGEKPWKVVEPHV